MIRFLVRRVLLALFTLTMVSIGTFLLFFAVPTNPAEIMCGRHCDPVTIKQTKQRLGLDEPLVVQYGTFVKGIFVGRDYGEGPLKVHCDAPCLGISFRTGVPVTDVLGRALPVTLSVVFGSLVVYLGVGVTLGMISALRRGTVFDKVSITTSLVGASLQIYFLGLVLMLVFTYQLGWLPRPEYHSPFEEGILTWAGGMLLPWITLGFINSAIFARLSRAQMLETLSEDFVRTAKAKGLRKGVVYRKHALRAAITPIVTMAGLYLGFQLGGTFITETVFSLNGLGREAVESVQELNLPIVMATVLLSAFFIIVMTVVVDFLYSVIDPRVRLE